MRTSRTVTTGDYRGYLWSLIFVSAAASLLVLLYRVFNPMLIEIWGTRQGWYLDTYRTWGAKIWRLLNRSSSSWIFLWLPILWMFSAYLPQSALRKSRAQKFNKLHSLLILALGAFAAFSFFRMLMRPLM